MKTQFRSDSRTALYIFVVSSENMFKKNRGKHKNAAQNKTMVSFMENHVDIARGHTKGDRVQVEQLWQELAQMLNSQGPAKDAHGWKKTFTDWKCEIRKKIAHNKTENRSTGGGHFNKHVLTDAEETIARITGMYSVVDGIRGCVSFGMGEEAPCELLDLTDDADMVVEMLDGYDDIPSASAKRSGAELSSTPKKSKREVSLQDCLKKSVQAQGQFNDNIQTILQNLVQSEEKKTGVLERIATALETTNDILLSIKTDMNKRCD